MPTVIMYINRTTGQVVFYLEGTFTESDEWFRVGPVVFGEVKIEIGARRPADVAREILDRKELEPGT